MFISIRVTLKLDQIALRPSANSREKLLKSLNNHNSNKVISLVNNPLGLLSPTSY